MIKNSFPVFSDIRGHSLTIIIFKVIRGQNMLLLMTTEVKIIIFLRKIKIIYNKMQTWVYFSPFFFFL